MAAGGGQWCRVQLCSRIRSRIQLRPVQHGAEVPIRDDVIRLGQFLKLADLAEDGAQARDLIADGEVRVNGEVELRRGRQLVRGDVVAVSLATGEESAQVG